MQLSVIHLAAAAIPARRTGFVPMLVPVQRGMVEQREQTGLELVCRKHVGEETFSSSLQGGSKGPKELVACVFLVFPPPWCQLCGPFLPILKSIWRHSGVLQTLSLLQARQAGSGQAMCFNIPADDSHGGESPCSVF